MVHLWVMGYAGCHGCHECSSKPAVPVATNTYLYSIIIGCHRIWVVFTTLHMSAFTEFTDSRRAMYVCVTKRNTRSTRKKLTGHGLFTIVMEAAFPCAAAVPTKG